MLAAKPSLTLTRRLAASPERVFAAWTEPAQLARWIGPERITVRVAEADTRVGGRFRFVFAEADGSEHEVAGAYLEIEEDARLVFSWAWRSTPERESQVTVTLARDGAGTLLTLRHERLFDEEARARHQGGWTQSLDKLERLVA